MISGSIDWNKFTVKLLCFLFVSAFIGVGISYSKIYFFHIVSALFFVVSGYQVKKGNVSFAKIKMTPFHVFVFFHFFWYSFSSIWSFSFAVSANFSYYSFLTLFLVMSLALIEQLDSALPSKVIKWLAPVFIVHLFLSLLEAFSQIRWPISSYSTLASFFDRSTMGAIYGPQKDIFLKQPTSFFFSPNHTALVSVMGLPFFIFHSRTLWKVFGSIVVGVAIFMSGSRSLLILFFLILILYLFYKTFIRFRLKELLIIGLPVFLIVFFLHNQTDTFWKKKFNSSYKMFTYYSVEAVRSLGFKLSGLKVEPPHGRQEARIIYLRGALKKFRESPLIGIGGGGLRGSPTVYNGKSYSLESMHNYWVEVLTECGVFFFLIYTFWFITCLFYVFKYLRRTKDKTEYYICKSLIVSGPLFFVGIITLSSGVYFLPKSILYSFMVHYGAKGFLLGRA